MDEVLVVTCTVSVDGSPLEAEWASGLARVVVDQYLESADRFGLYFGERGLELFDAEIFKPGAKIEIKVAPSDAKEPLLQGEVTAAAPELVAGKPSTLQVDGFDGWYRWGRERKRRTFLDMTAGDIVRRVASDMGLKADVESGDKLDYTIQDNITDLAFLLTLARNHRFELAIDNEKVSFKKPAEKEKPVATFTYGEDLLQFVPRETAARQPSEVVVRGWDPKAKKPVIGKAGTGEEEAVVGRGEKAGDVVSKAFGKAGSLEVEKPVSTEAEAAALAKRLLSEMTMGFLEIEATVVGNAVVRPGKMIAVKGVGELYEGEYYVTRTQHRLSPRGYVTMIWGRRNAFNKNEPPPVKAEEAKEEKKDHWCEITFEDPEGKAVAVGAYGLRASDGAKFTGTVGSDGTLRHDGIAQGDCRVALKVPQMLSWARGTIMAGEEAVLQGTVPGAAGEQVTVEIYQAQREKQDQSIASVNATAAEDDSFEAVWKPSGLDRIEGWTEFVAKVVIGKRWAKSTVLTVKRRSLRNLRWSVAAARADDEVELFGEASGFRDGAEVQWTIWQYDAKGSDKKVAELKPTTVAAETIRQKWKYVTAEAKGDEVTPFRPVEYFFEAKIKVDGEEYAAKSDYLSYRDWIEIDLVDPDGAPYRGEPYVMYLADGSRREGTLDEKGRAVERELPGGPVRVKFPGLAETDDD